jgi:TRAP-type C4-dicarboxylate transport system substrate-binding protein
MRKAVASMLVLALAMAIPGSISPVQAKAGNMIRIATLAPRDTDLTRGFVKIDRGLRKATGDAWGIQLYPSGIAGDEKDVIRKMRIGQMDASILTDTGLSQIVREATVLSTPGVVNNYDELGRVQTAMNKEWGDTFEKAGFKLISWGEVGQYRYFSKKPLKKPSDIKGTRPWLWPESYVMKEIYQAVGANGVPLGVPEVYGALQTGMVDFIISTAIATVALQWHSKLTNVTNDTFGVLLGAMIMNNDKWKSIPDDVRASLGEQIKTNYEGDSSSVRKDDDNAYKKLLSHGFTGTAFTPEGKAEYEKMTKTVRDHLVGRVYPKDLLDRVTKIARGQ